MFDTRKFGAYISKLRKDADMTQSSLAEQLNLTRQSISQYENGDCFPDVTILIKISEIFKITLDDLIKSGEPTVTEAQLLKITSKKDELPSDILVEDVVNIAPFLKPSILEKIAEGLMKHEIDISKLVELAKFMSDEKVVELLDKATFETLDEELIEKLAPFLNDESKYKIFEKVLDGELNYNFLKIILPYSNEYMISQIEAAVVYGVLDQSALKIMRNKN
jgi:Predicted transcriptional regulators